MMVAIDTKDRAHAIHRLRNRAYHDLDDANEGGPPIVVSLNTTRTSNAIDDLLTFARAAEEMRSLLVVKTASRFDTRTASYTGPSWLQDLYADPREKASRKNLKLLISKMGDLLRDRRFAEIDALLENAHWSRLPPEIVMALPRLSYVARDSLQNWTAATAAATGELTRRGLPVEQMMVGVIDSQDARQDQRQF